MAIKYVIDGDIFREIDEKFLVAHVNEYLINARAIQTDAAGNKIELFQLNDGRWFSRAVTPHFKDAITKESILSATILNVLGEVDP
jgi:hypothetical protein